MSQCLHCGQICDATAMYCDACLTLLKAQQEPQDHQVHVDVVDAVTAPAIASFSDGEDGNSFFHASGAAIAVEEPTSEENEYVDVVEQTLRKLNNAARRIETLRRSPGRYLRPLHLALYRDISSEIQRQSTPMPREDESADLQERLLAIWPWLEDEEESEQDTLNHTDPLASRHLPGSFPVQPEAPEPVQKVSDSMGLSRPRERVRQRLSTSRMLIISLLACALLALLADGILGSIALLRPHAATPPVAMGSPTLTLSLDKVNYGQTVSIHIIHFSPVGFVFLTRDIGERVKTQEGDAFIRVNSSGSRDLLLSIDGTWSPGLHTLEAEDVSTHYTASATLQVASGPTSPTRLDVSSNALNFGADMPGANTTQTLTLYNSGSGTISWSASSDQPWLQITPTRGVYSDSEPLIVGVQRNNLRPGNYSGAITISTNVGGSRVIEAAMTVHPFPSNTSAVLSATPAVMAFNARDNSAKTGTQVLTISNPGTQNLYWSLLGNQPGAFSDAAFTPRRSWLVLEQTTGTVAPGATSQVRVRTYSQKLLPGVYINNLLFNVSMGHTMLDAPQRVVVALTVQSQCGVTLGDGVLSFTAVSGQGNPGNQTLNLTAGSSCAGAISWQASSAASWLTITPGAGQLAFGAATTTVIGVNSADLKPATYTANISIIAGQTSQSVVAQLVVQSPPPPMAPIMAVSPPNLNFSTNQNQGNPPGQAVTITDTGQSPLLWQTSINAQSSSWLGVYPASGTILPGASAQLTVSVSAQGLTPGTYAGQIVLSGFDVRNVQASGSPQTVMVNFTIMAPCSLAQVSPSALVFNVAQGSASVMPSSVTMTATGDCSWPLKWHLLEPNRVSWLNFSARAGSFSASGQPVTISVSPSAASLKPGNYSTRIIVEATSNSGMNVAGSPQTFTVMLNVTRSVHSSGPLMVPFARLTQLAVKYV